MSTALVTGPSSGIGEGFARRLASDGYDLVLVARDEARLSRLADELAMRGVNVEVMVVDLGDREQLADVERRLAEAERPIDVLVNNAGFALGQRFIGGDITREQSAIDVMVTAVMRLSHAALPGMVSRERGAIINVSSMASFLPSGTYSAAKAWVTFFTQGLASELHGSAVRTIAVCPGYVRTDFYERAAINVDQSSDTWWLEVNTVVDQAMDDLLAGKLLSVAGRGYRALAAGSRLVPRDVLRRFEQRRRERRARAATQ